MIERFNPKRIKEIIRLSFSIAKANFKTRNQGSFLGIFWYLLEPLLFFIILMTIRSAFNSDIEHYGLYLFLGLIMFNLFSKSTNAAVNSLIGNAKFIKSIKISYVALVLSALIQVLLGHLFEIILFILLMVYYSIPISGIIFYPIILVSFILFTLGISLFLSVVGVHIKDISNIWNVFTRVVWFGTPIFYVISSESIRGLLNPIYYFIKTAREIVIYGTIPEVKWIIGIIIFPIISIIIGYIFFNIFRKGIAEKI
ncbi:MAG: ABC transporter permease [Candidatus Woesearchaeota archaeon]